MSSQSLIKTLGSGILFASTAIGVSHLVQSTRAGADYGFALLWIVVAANVLKFPFFEYGSRYANVTGKSLIDGYAGLGRWMLWIYLGVTLCSMFFVASAVNAVSAGFFDNLFGISSLTPSFPQLPVALLLGICMAILLRGKYKALDGVIKVIGSVMVFTTLVAFTFTIIEGPTTPRSEFLTPEIWTPTSIVFIIAIIGWMPSAIDLSTWNSLWTLERIQSSGYKPSLRQTLSEFNMGYWMSALLAVCFLTLGAYLMFGTGKELSDSAVTFSGQVISLYTTAIGDWSGLLISTAAFSIMFGTLIGVLDGYSRAVERTVELLFLSPEKTRQFRQNRLTYMTVLMVLSAVSFGIITWFAGQLRSLVDLATTISFLIAPLLAIVNFYLVNRKEFPDEGKPGIIMKALSYIGIVFLSGFAVYYFFMLSHN